MKVIICCVSKLSPTMHWFSLIRILILQKKVLYMMYFLMYFIGSACYKHLKHNSKWLFSLIIAYNLCSKVLSMCTLWSRLNCALIFVFTLHYIASTRRYLSVLASASGTIHNTRGRGSSFRSQNVSFRAAISLKC